MIENQFIICVINLRDTSIKYNSMADEPIKSGDPPLARKMQTKTNERSLTLPKSIAKDNTRRAKIKKA